MSQNHELDSLRAAEQEAFDEKQRLWKIYADLRDSCRRAYDVMDSAWKERVSAREKMNSEYEIMQQTSRGFKEVWDEYGRIRDNNNYEIRRLRAEADSEHQQMIECFERASECYQYGDKSEAPYWSEQGHAHKERRNELNARVSELCGEVKTAKQDAEFRAPRTDASAFRQAKAVFKDAKSCHEAAQSEFKRLKAERDRAKAKFDIAQKEYVRAKDVFQKRLKEVKAANQRERDRVLDKAGVKYSERKDAKIVKKADGTTQIYHGGIGSGDGAGHGHTTLDQFGRKTYDRGAFEEHGGQNFTEDGKGFTMYNRRARTQTEIGGSGEGNYINVRTGEGHTTQWYKDGYRVSWDTKDGGKTEQVHWTNQNVSKRKPNERHKEPDDSNL